MLPSTFLSAKGNTFLFISVSQKIRNKTILSMIKPWNVVGMFSKLKQITNLNLAPCPA